MSEKSISSAQYLYMKTLSAQKIQQLQQMAAAAQQAAQGGHFAQAETLLKDVLKAAPQAWDVMQMLAMLYVQNRKPVEAAKYFRQIVQANPTHAPSHANLAIALSESGEFETAVKEFHRAITLDKQMALGLQVPVAEALQGLQRYEEAIECYRQALNAEKKHHPAFYGMARAYQALKDYSRALECYEHAVGIMPENALYHYQFAGCLRSAKLLGLSANHYHEAAKLRPDWLDAIVVLAEVMLEQRRFDEALECLDRALQLKPRNLELMERKGYVYQAMGNTDAAIAMFEQVTQQNEDREMALLGLGRSHMEDGRSEQAIQYYTKAIDKFPDCYQAYYHLAGARKYKLDDPIIPVMKTLADEMADEHEATIGLSFALGKVLDDSKQWDEAFHYYVRANRLKNQQYDYKPEEDITRVDHDVAVFTSETLALLQKLGSTSEMPVFIVGMPRSGTTLTEQIISSHPQVIGAGEVVFWNEAPTSIPRLIEDNNAEYPDCVQRLQSSHAEVITTEYLKLLHKITGAGEGITRITDKMPHNFLYLGLIASLFPKARIVHCKRDAMDNCLSIFFQNFGAPHPYAYDLKNLGHHHCQYQRLMQHWHAVLPGRILDLNYEDVIADPEYWSRQLIDHVGLPWDDACLAPHKMERNVKTASLWQVRQPIYKTSVQRWKNYEVHLGPLRQALGLE